MSYAWVDKLDALVKQGKTSQVQARLRKKLPPRFPRENLVKLASICRRIGMANRGIVLLNRVVRGTSSRAPNPVPSEIVEYATCLVHAGAPEEAVSLLKDISHRDYPQAMMAVVFAEVAQWHYPATIPLLKEYLDHPKPSPYERLVARANLGAAYLAMGEYEKALRLLIELEKQTKSGDFSLLRASTVQLLAQTQLFLGDWAKAEASLETAGGLLGQAGEVPLLLVQKWKIFMELLRHGHSEKTARRLRALRDRARVTKQWETLRECDRFEASAKRDEKLLIHLYFGTEWASYRSRILSGFGSELRIPSEYRWGLQGGRSAPTFTVSDGTWGGGQVGPKINQGIHRLIGVLSRDFYRPFRLPELHSRLFPGNYYNPFTSPKRVHRLIGRLRRWLEEHSIPLEVGHEDDRYQWLASGPISLLVRNPVLQEDPRVESIRQSFGDRSFSSLELSDAFGKSRATVQRMINELEEKGTIARVRGGKNTRYQLALEERVD